MRDFNKWLSQFKSSIAGYDYYVDFDKVCKNVDEIKVELNILNSLIGSKNIESDFENLISKYPETLKCIPILLAVRQSEIYVMDEEEYLYNFKNRNYGIENYKVFMKKTGLFNMLQNHVVNNLIDYCLGIETGLDSNGRKNRGGHNMEDLVEKFLKEAGVEYYKEVYSKDIEKKWKVDLGKISNQNKNTKRFDFVVKGADYIYGIECNFYGGGGSKLNETARSYKMLATEAREIKGFKFVWITDGIGWISARNGLKETFEVMEHLYSIKDLEEGIVSKKII